MKLILCKNWISPSGKKIQAGKQIEVTTDLGLTLIKKGYVISDVHIKEEPKEIIKKVNKKSKKKL